MFTYAFCFVVGILTARLVAFGIRWYSYPKGQDIDGATPQAFTSPPNMGHRSKPLTTREKQVAILASMDLTNGEIGKHLAISERTVGNHLHHVFDKLGIHSRQELKDVPYITEYQSSTKALK